MLSYGVIIRVCLCVGFCELVKVACFVDTVGNASGLRQTYCSSSSHILCLCYLILAYDNFVFVFHTFWTNCSLVGLLKRNTVSEIASDLVVMHVMTILLVGLFQGRSSQVSCRW